MSLRKVCGFAFVHSSNSLPSWASGAGRATQTGELRVLPLTCSREKNSRRVASTRSILTARSPHLTPSTLQTAPPGLQPPIFKLGVRGMPLKRSQGDPTVGSFRENSCGARLDSQLSEWQDCFFSNIFNEKLQTYSKMGGWGWEIHKHLSAHHPDPVINFAPFYRVSLY